MTASKLKTDICIIGAGSGGLSLTAGAVQMGARVVLIERSKMGGDCLNYGCVPSKALIAAGDVANIFRNAQPFGITNVKPAITYNKIAEHVKRVIASIAPNDSVERFEKLGVTVIKANAKFKNKNTVIAGNQEIQAKYIIIATGSSPRIPPIPGLNHVNYYTNETIFDLTEQPTRLLVIGGGPIGCELAQAHARLGTPVVLLEGFKILPKDDPDCTAVVKEQLVKDGLDIKEAIKIEKIEKTNSNIILHFEQDGQKQKITGSHLLVSTGRQPNLATLDLEKASVKYSPQGITVDKRLRSTNKSVYAIGDAAGSFQFTHAANYHAGIVIRNILFKLPAKVNYKALPWVTYTDPELSHVGLTEADCQRQNKSYKILNFNFTENDRAQTDYSTEGKVNVLVDKKGYILGATIVGKQAGELILPWVLAINENLKIGALANIIAPYPTRSEISKHVAGSYYTPFIFSNRIKKIVRFLLKF